MKAMVMAAGLGTRLRPLTYEIPKPLVPVANRPIMEHILVRLGRNELGEVIANLHWFPDTITDRFGDGSRLGIELTYSYEEELLGTAGGVRNVREYFGSDPFLVMAADALTDLANCMIYVLAPEAFDYFPDQLAVDFALDVFPALLEHDVPFHAHVTDGYWNDVGSLPEFLQGNLDVLGGAVAVEPAGEVVEGDADVEAGEAGISGRVLVGEGAEIAADARIDGPTVVGPGARVGAGAMVKESVLLPGAEVPANAMLAASIAGGRGRLA